MGTIYYCDLANQTPKTSTFNRGTFARLAVAQALLAGALCAAPVAAQTPITDVRVARQNPPGLVFRSAHGTWLHAQGHPGQLLVSPPATAGNPANLAVGRWYLVAAQGGFPTSQWQYDHQLPGGPWVFFDTHAGQKRRR